jgi:tetratricopeptide (TPR) repeat protein
VIAWLAAAGCASFSPERHHCVEPDRRLAEALRLLGDTAPEVGDACSLGRNCGQARRTVDRLAAVCPTHVPTLLVAASLAFETGDAPAAQRSLDEVARLAPRDAGATVLRARIAVKEGNLRYARRLVEGEIRLVPDSPALRETLAGLLYLQQQFAEARVALQAAARLGAPAWRTAYHLGLLDEAVGDAETAARRYAEALDLNPAWHPARARLEGLRATRGVR